MRLRLAAILLPAVFVAVAPSDAAAPASKGRLVLVSEMFHTASVEVLGDAGKPIVVSIGVGTQGAAAVAPSGTRVAIVTTVAPFDPDLPGQAPRVCS